jgi:hypothetical protein
MTLKKTPLSQRLIRFARRSPRAQLWIAKQMVLQQLQVARATLNHQIEKKTVLQRLQVARATLNHQLLASGWPVDYQGYDRTAYIIGLYGAGRSYISTLMTQHLGKRAIYVRESVRYHPAPTSLIYSGHAGLKYAAYGQHVPPEVTHRLLQSVRAGYADLIFIYRHPLDSLLTNWSVLRTYIRQNGSMTGSISRVYKNTDDLCADLERNFLEFKGFADGDPAFSASLSGPRFFSFAEFVEETALFIAAATLSLRLEDFLIDPLKEFSRMARVMSVDLDSTGLQLARPRTQPYRYKAVAEGVPRFRRFIDELDAETRRRIERMGYDVCV